MMSRVVVLMRFLRLVVSERNPLCFHRSAIVRPVTCAKRVVCRPAPTGGYSWANPHPPTRANEPS
jgi:hypothetical protein